MASSQNSKGDKPAKAKMPKGVRGPGGPPASSASSGGSQRSQPGSRPAPSSRRKAFEERSYPLVRKLNSLPRWLVVIAPALLLFGGLIMTGSLAWLGAILLALVTLILAWLTALSWPVISPGSRLLRGGVVLALGGMAVLKALGRF
ncbi:MAG: hypothetical protein NTX29_01755 [Actinobacteria bacterium]|nr:hypothetical protein [Actinomycetota bacterium]